MKGLEDEIRWQKEFINYEVLPDEHIRINFGDESECIVDLLVGADASNSRVHKQYLPQYERKSLEVTAIPGRTRLTDHLKSSLPQQLFDGSPNSIVPASANWMFFLPGVPL